MWILWATVSHLFVLLFSAPGSMAKAQDVEQPYTPDLQGRARLSLEFLAESCNLKRGGLPLWWDKFNLDQPSLWHEDHIYMQFTGLWVDALVRIRHMTVPEQAI